MPAAGLGKPIASNDLDAQASENARPSLLKVHTYCLLVQDDNGNAMMTMTATRHTTKT